MKLYIPGVKNALKYVTFAIAILIMIIQFYFISVEITNQELSLESLAIKENSKNEYCQESGLTKLRDLIFKSVMAFFAGCLLSEKKFIRIGII